MILIHLLCAGRPGISDLQYSFSKRKPLLWGEAGSSLFPVGVIHAITVFTARLVFSGGSGSKESACNAGDLDWEDSLEEGMATHSGILAWRILWREEPGEAKVHGVIQTSFGGRSTDTPHFGGLPAFIMEGNDKF